MNDQTALVLIDVQEGFNDPVWGKRNNSQFEQKVSQLLDHWRVIRNPVIHVQHLSIENNSPLRADCKGSRFMSFVAPSSGEAIVTKNVNSAFIGTELEKCLRKVHVKNLVLAGLTTDHCVSTSARMARNLGFHVVVASDATATFDRTLPGDVKFDADLVHRVSLASLNNEFASILSIQEIVQFHRGYHR
jgi:nicotinamidase-related amidase